MQKLLPSEHHFKTRDPFVIKHKDRYYHCFTPDTDSVWIACSDTIEGLAQTEAKQVYCPEPDKPYSKQLWAPELHIIDGKCYIYVACDDGKNANHRMYVLENHSDDPMEPYQLHGKISDATDKWAIDGTVMQYQNALYFIWSGWEGDRNGCQNLYIARMKNPYEIGSKRVMIATPEYPWEKIGCTGLERAPFINEGPFAWISGEDCYLLYSASGSWCEGYCIAYLKLTGENPLHPTSWEKCKEPVLCKNHAVKGAGHCSVLCENDENHIFFHAWEREEPDVQWNTVSVWHGLLKMESDKLVIQ